VLSATAPNSKEATAAPTLGVISALFNMDAITTHGINCNDGTADV